MHVRKGLDTGASERASRSSSFRSHLRLHPFDPSPGAPGPLPLCSHEDKARFPQDREHTPGERGSLGREPRPWCLGRGTGSEWYSRGRSDVGQVRVACSEPPAKERDSSGVLNMGWEKGLAANFAHGLWVLECVGSLFSPELNSVSQTNSFGAALPC